MLTALYSYWLAFISFLYPMQNPIQDERKNRAAHKPLPIKRLRSSLPGFRKPNYSKGSAAHNRHQAWAPYADEWLKDPLQHDPYESGSDFKGIIDIYYLHCNRQTYNEYIIDT